MAVTLITVPTVIISDLTPGATKTVNFVVDAPQPPNTATATVTANFNGESTSAPLTIQYDTPPIVPTVVVDVGTASNLEVSVGTPTSKPGTVSQWNVPVTFTAI